MCLLSTDYNLDLLFQLNKYAPFPLMQMSDNNSNINNNHNNHNITKVTIILIIITVIINFTAIIGYKQNYNTEPISNGRI